jgi:hypothetical protein
MQHPAQVYVEKYINCNPRVKNSTSHIWVATAVRTQLHRAIAVSYLCIITHATASFIPFYCPLKLEFTLKPSYIIAEETETYLFWITAAPAVSRSPHQQTRFKISAAKTYSKGA